MILRYARDSRFRNRKLAFFIRVLIGLIFILLPLESVSQSLNSPPLIASVSVVVDGQSSEEGLERLIPIKKGELFSLKRINSSIKQIYKTGLFSEIQVAREGEQEVHLTYLLKRKLIARRIIFQTKEKIPQTKLRNNLISLREGTFFSEQKLEKAVEELKEILTHEGFFHPEIEAFTKKDQKSSSFDVFFRIVSFKKYIVKDINFTGEMVIPEEKLMGEVRSQKGKEYIPSLLEEDITRLKELLYSSGYQRAEIEAGENQFNEQEGSVSLFVDIIPHEKIEIEVRGARVPLELLRPIWEVRIFEDWGLTEGRAKILDHMRKKGYLFASVTSSIEKESNKMRVIYTVTPNKKQEIIGISYYGLEYFTPSQLEAELVAGEASSLLNWIDGEKLFKLPEEIESLYKSRGFPNAQVDFVFLRKGRGVKVQFQIQEGNQQKIKSISFEGAQLFEPGTLFEQISSFESGPFFPLNIQKDIEKLENLYLNQGFRETKVIARVEEVEKDLFSVSFIIEEGQKLKIEKIVITGNVSTNRKTILRELRIKEGDFAYSDKISESKRRLEKLGIFTTVKIEEISLSSESENLVINVREGQRNYAGLGLGIETETKPRAFAVWDSPLRLRGIAEIIRSNVFGSSGQASLIGQLSLKEKRVVLTWEQPYFFGLPLQTYLNAWLEQEARESFTYDRQGVSLTTIKPITEKTLLLLATLQWAGTTLIDLQIEPNEVDRQFSPYSATSISGSVIWDKRDDLFNPERGSFFSFVLERAFPLLEKDSNYIKTFLKSQHFIPILPKVTFSLTSRLGMGGGKVDIPIHERFFAGGSNSFRGARFDELGPVDEESQKPVGGQALLLLNFELTFPLVSGIRNLRGAVFCDIGNVFEKANDISLTSLQSAAGFGIRYKTPLGPVRLELGWNLDVPKEERKARFYITIGNVF